MGLFDRLASDIGIGTPHSSAFVQRVQSFNAELGSDIRFDDSIPNGCYVETNVDGTPYMVIVALLEGNKVLVSVSSNHRFRDGENLRRIAQIVDGFNDDLNGKMPGARYRLQGKEGRRCFALRTELPWASFTAHTFGTIAEVFTTLINTFDGMLVQYGYV